MSDMSFLRIQLYVRSWSTHPQLFGLIMIDLDFSAVAQICPVGRCQLTSNHGHNTGAMTYKYNTQFLFHGHIFFFRKSIFGVSNSFYLILVNGLRLQIRHIFILQRKNINDITFLNTIIETLFYYYSFKGKFLKFSHGRNLSVSKF